MLALSRRFAFDLLVGTMRMDDTFPAPRLELFAGSAGRASAIRDALPIGSLAPFRHHCGKFAICRTHGLAAIVFLPV
jgi:hypothetical protein